VYTVRACNKEASADGDLELLALAICVDPWHDLEDVSDSAELQSLLAYLPEDQLAFRRKVNVTIYLSSSLVKMKC
jgi:hypothetical protein